jgi:quercetin dioxygenase-like cupin family protein
MPDAARGDVAVLGAGQGEVLDVLGVPLVVRIDPARLGALLAEQVAPPGYTVPPHVHAVDDEALIILEGELTLFDGSAERLAKAGETVSLPRGSRHAFRNARPGPARYLLLVTPGHQAVAMFRAFDRAAKQAGPGGLQPPELIAICAAHGVTIG